MTGWGKAVDPPGGFSANDGAGFAGNDVAKRVPNARKKRKFGSRRSAGALSATGITSSPKTRIFARILVRLHLKRSHFNGRDAPTARPRFRRFVETPLPFGGKGNGGIG